MTTAAVRRSNGWWYPFDALREVYGDRGIDAALYGAVGDGTTDDTAAIQAAIDEAAAAGGAVVWLGPYLYLVGQLVLQNRVQLIGSGMHSTVLKAKASLNDSVIVNYVSGDQVEANAEFCAVRNLMIDGDKDNQTSGDGIYFSTNPGTSDKADDDIDFDTHFLVENVLIYKANDLGFNADGRSESRLVNVHAYYCGSHGFSPAQDTYLVACSAGQCGGDGFYLDSPSERLYGCKAFYSSNAGFHLTNHGAELVGCEAQDNNHEGFLLDGCESCILSGAVADSNSRTGSGTYPGIYLYGAQACVVDILCMERGVANGGAGYQLYGIKFGNSSSRCQVKITNRGVAGGTVNATVDPASTGQSGAASMSGNAVDAAAQRGYSYIAYAASITPNPFDGEVVFVGTLTDNITVNNPTSGFVNQRLTLVFTQDGTGTRTVAFGNKFKYAWSPSTTGGKMNTISFVFDGTNWIQTASAVGL